MKLARVFLVVNCCVTSEYILQTSVLMLDHCLHNISTKDTLYKIYGDFGTLRSCTGAKFHSS